MEDLLKIQKYCQQIHRKIKTKEFTLLVNPQELNFYPELLGRKLGELEGNNFTLDDILNI